MARTALAIHRSEVEAPTGFAAKPRETRRSLLALVFLAGTRLSPWLRERLWRWIYDRLAAHDPQAEQFLAMNYGYADVREDTTRAPALEPRDEPYRYELQLYRHVTDGIELAGKDVLEVGCGRGGGASYVARYFHPNRILAVDLAAQAVASCQALHRLPNLTFQQASAASLPCASASIDVVINVESSHCYADIAGFIAEVRRVLRPGGYLAFCDLRWPRVAAELRQQFDRAGFVERRHRIITENVLAALDRLAERRQGICHAVPRWLRPAMRDFIGVRDTAVYDMLRAGRLAYVSLLLQKPQLVARAERPRSNSSFGEGLAIR